MKDKLKSQLKKYYLSKEVSPDFSVKKKSSFQWAFLAPALVAVALLMFFTLTPNYNMQVMKEVAYNHNKNLSPEVLTEDLGTIQEALPKLDFTLVASNKLKKNNWKIVGARYCSIKGKIAAQIKLLNTQSDKTYTLYQASIDIDIADSSEYIDGAHVKLWTEKGLVFSLAGPH